MSMNLSGHKMFLNIYLLETDLFTLIAGWTYLPTNLQNASQRAASAEDSTEAPDFSFYNPRSWHNICYHCPYV